jgi:tRNA (guanine26-N2/guanine27-N2)-dimethyltransferase
VAATAAKQDIGIKVLLSHSTDHYIRAYAEIAYGAKKADDSVKNLGYIWHCFNCLHRETAKTAFSLVECPECGDRMDYAGPLWLGNIQDESFCELLRKENTRVAFRNSVRIDALLSLAGYESEAPALHYVVDEFSSKLQLPEPSLLSIIKMLLERGFEAGPTHFNSRGFRTNASASEIQDLFKEAAKIS